MALLGNQTQPLAGSQLSSVHGLASSHVITLPDVQPQPLPTLPHTSPLVHKLPSLHEPTCGLNTQLPLPGSQTSPVHGLPSSQVTLAPAQVVPVQASASVQALPSSQLALAGVWVQTLPLPSHASVVQGLPSSHKPSSVLPSQLSSIPLQISLLFLPSLEHLALAKSPHTTTPPLQPPTPHVPPMPMPPAEKPSSVLPSQLSSSPLQSSALGIFALWQTCPPLTHTGLPGQLPRRNLQVLLMKSQLSPLTVQSLGREHAAPLPPEKPCTAQVASLGKSSERPLQSSSRPLQTSALGVAALHALRPLALQLRTPLHLPLKQVVEIAAVMAQSEQEQMPLLARHWPLVQV